MALAVANYHEVHGHLPPAFIADEDGKPLLSWRVLILPYLDQQPLFEKFDLTEAWDGPNNSKLLDQMPSLYRLHTINDEHTTSTNYVAVVGEETVWSGTEPRDYDFATDGTAHTLMVAEFVGHPIPWTKPEDLVFDEMDLTVDSDKGICSVLTPPGFVSMDGSVRYLPRDTHPETVRALLTANGGEEAPTKFLSYHDGRLRPRKAD